VIALDFFPRRNLWQKEKLQKDVSQQQKEERPQQREDLLLVVDLQEKKPQKEELKLLAEKRAKDANRHHR
jgi:hypothetical protein